MLDSRQTDAYAFIVWLNYLILWETTGEKRCVDKAKYLQMFLPMSNRPDYLEELQHWMAVE